MQSHLHVSSSLFVIIVSITWIINFTLEIENITCHKLFLISTINNELRELFNSNGIFANFMKNCSKFLPPLGGHSALRAACCAEPVVTTVLCRGAGFRFHTRQRILRKKGFCQKEPFFHEKRFSQRIRNFFLALVSFGPNAQAKCELLTVSKNIGHWQNNSEIENLVGCFEEMLFGVKLESLLRQHA